MDNNICEQIQIAIMSDEALTDEQLKHIEACPECSALLSQVKEMRSGLEGFTVPGISEGEIADIVMSKVAKNKTIPFPALRMSRHIGTVASLLIICAVALILKGNIPTIAPDDPVEQDTAITANEKSGFTVNGTFGTVEDGYNDKELSLLNDTVTEAENASEEAVVDEQNISVDTATATEETLDAPVLMFKKKAPTADKNESIIIGQSETDAVSEPSDGYGYTTEAAYENDAATNNAVAEADTALSGYQDAIEDQETEDEKIFGPAYAPGSENEVAEETDVPLPEAIPEVTPEVTPEVIPECDEYTVNPSDNHRDVQSTETGNTESCDGSGGGSNAAAIGGGGAGGGGGGGGSSARPLEEYVFSELEFLNGDENLDYNIELANKKLFEIGAGFTVTKEKLENLGYGNEFFTSAAKSISLDELKNIFE